MRICIDTRGAKLYAGTGIGTYTARLMENIMSIDHKNEYDFYWSNDGYDFMLNQKNIHVTLFGEKNKKFWDETYLPSLLSKKNMDIFHLPQNGLGLPKDKYCSYIVTLHDLIPFTMPETCGKSYVDRFAEEMPHIVETSDIIITVSNYSKQDIVKYFNISDDKVKVTYLAADSRFRMLPKESARQFMQNEYHYSGNYILYLGGFSPRKNVDGLLESFRQVYKELPESYDLVLIGASKDNHYELKKKLSSMGISDRVVLTGYVPYEHLPYFYNCASLFVYPSFYEGFGLPPLEAMTCGTPTITTNVTSIPEIVSDGAITIDPYDLDALSSNIYSLLTDSDQRNQLIEKALKRAYNFSWKKTAIETIQLYASLNK